jgi:hypothetical protein
LWSVGLACLGRSVRSVSARLVGFPAASRRDRRLWRLRRAEPRPAILLAILSIRRRRRSCSAAGRAPPRRRGPPGRPPAGPAAAGRATAKSPAGQSPGRPLRPPAPWRAPPRRCSRPPPPPDHRTVLVDQADRRPCQANVQSDLLRHGCSPWLEAIVQRVVQRRAATRNHAMWESVAAPKRKAAILARDMLPGRSDAAKRLRLPC